MPKILFLRGLNTYGDELQRLGPLKFGEIATPLVSAFRLADLELIAVPDLGTGTLEEHVDNAARALEKLPCWQTDDVFHLLGHSLGGLIARALVQRPSIRTRILSVGSFGTPHRGAQIAEIASQLQTSHPVMQKVMAWFKYDTQTRAHCFSSLSPDAILDFNDLTPDHPEIDYFSAVCAIPPHLQTIPFRLLNLQIRKWLDFRESDGAIHADSQRHGRILGVYQLDHLMEVGYCIDMRPRIRKHFQSEFTRLAGDLTRYYRDFGRAPQL